MPPETSAPAQPLAHITFGQAGNAQQFQGEGWAEPETDFTWSTGRASRLSIPYAAGEGMLTLELRASPMRAPPALTAQVVTLVVNGVVYGTERLAHDSVLGFDLTTIQSGQAGRAEVELRHPDAAVPAEHFANEDRRCLALCMRELKLRWVPRRPGFTPRHRPRLVVPAREFQDDIVRGCTALLPADLMLRFQSLGHNCEFGLVQRHIEAEPLGLLRFAGIEPHDVLQGLPSAFAGIDDSDQIELEQEDNKGELQYLIRCAKYHMQFHSFLPVSKRPPVVMHYAMLRHLAFLRRHFEDALRGGDSIFVLHHQSCASAAQLRPFLHALRQWGANALLFVTAGTGNAGSVDQLAADLFHGHIDQLMSQEVPDVIDAPAWLSICANTYRMWREAGGGKD